MKSGIGSSVVVRPARPACAAQVPTRIVLKTTGNNRWDEEFSTNKLFTEIFKTECESKGWLSNRCLKLSSHLIGREKHHFQNHYKFKLFCKTDQKLVIRIQYPTRLQKICYKTFRIALSDHRL